MAQVPQIPAFARLTMNQSKPAGNHPDASLVAGFVERSLTPSLRTQVLEHLAGCPQCRGLVFLAAPQNAPALEAQKGFQWRMPQFRYSFRWAAAAASAAVVAGAIWLANPIVANKTTPNPVSTVAMNTAPAANVADRSADSGVASTQSALAKPRTVRKAPRVETVKPSATETVAVNTAPPVEFDPRSMYQTSLSTAVNPGSSLPKAVAPVRPGMQFMIAGPGTLYRSADKGQSWQSMDTLQNGLTAAASVGSVVLAGNTDGELFRSEDNGFTWMPIASWKPAGTVTKIEIRDVKNASVQTANGIWTTSDGCLTWHKQ